MMDWLRDRLRKWLLDDGKPQVVSDRLEINYNGRRVLVQAVGISGLYLNCREMNGGMCGLVSGRDAVDPDHFWKLWRQLGGGKACWADGTPYDPSAGISPPPSGFP